MKFFGDVRIQEGGEIRNAVIDSGSEDPTNPNIGELFFRTDLAQLRVFNGISWVGQIGAAWGGITGTLSHQVDLQSALNLKANLADVVTLAGEQTIIGPKTFRTNVRFGVAGSPAALQMTNTTVGANTFDIGLLGGDIDPIAYIWHRYNAPIHVRTNNLPRVTVEAYGGINIHSPSINNPALIATNATASNATIARFFGATSDLTFNYVGAHVDAYVPGSLVGDMVLRCEANGFNIGTVNGPLRFSTGSQAIMALTTSGNVTINSPLSGSALTVRGLTGVPIQMWTDGTRTMHLVPTSGRIDLGTITGDNFGLQTGHMRRVDITAAGNIHIMTPDSGTALTVATLSGVVGADIGGVHMGTGVGHLGGSNKNIYSFGPHDFAIGTIDAGGIHLRTNSSSRQIIGAAGNVTINTPDSGVALVVNNTHPANVVIADFAAATNRFTINYANIASAYIASTAIGDIALRAETNNLNLGALNGATRIGTGSRLIASFGVDGNVFINAPVSGDTLTVNGSVVATTFSGGGSGLTALNASQLTHGTIASARLPTNMALLDTTQIFTGFNTFSNTVNITPTLAAGVFSAHITGAAGAARDILLAGQTGFSNGFVVRFDGSQMSYVFNTGYVLINPPVFGATLNVGGGVGILAAPNMRVSHAGSSIVEITDAIRSVIIGADSADGWVGTFSNHVFTIRQNNVPRAAWGTGGNVTFYAPSSGSTLTAFQTPGVVDSVGLVVAGTDPTVFNRIILNDTIGTKVQFLWGNSAVGIFGLRNKAAIYLDTADPFAIWTQATERFIVSGAGNVTIHAPSSGTTLTTTAVAGGTSQVWSDGTRAAVLNHPPGRIDFGTATSDALSFMTTYIRRVEIGAAGNVTINTPSSGTALIVHNTPAANVVLSEFIAATNRLTINYSTMVGGFLSPSDIGDIIIRTEANGLNIGTFNGVTRIGTALRSIATFGSAGNVTISPPASGTALTINPHGTSHGLVVVGSTTNDLVHFSNGPVTAACQLDMNNAYFGTRSNHFFNLMTNGIVRSYISPTGNIIINAPFSGSHIINVISGLAGGLTVTAPTASELVVTNGTCSAFLGVFAPAGYTGTRSNHNFEIYTNNILRTTFSTAGNVTIHAPASGVTLNLAQTGASVRTSYFTSGPSDPNFRLGFHNGSGTTINSEHAALTFDYAGTGIASIGFFRASGPTCAQVNFNIGGLTPINYVENGNVTINPPLSGSALTVRGLTGVPIQMWTDGNRTMHLVPTSGRIDLGTITGDNFGLQTGHMRRVDITAAGNIHVMTPDSGIPLIVFNTPVANVVIADFTAATNRFTINYANIAGAYIASAGVGDIALRAEANHLNLGALNGATRIGTGSRLTASFGVDGNVFINAPVSGTTLTINGVLSGTSQLWSDGVRGAAIMHSAGRVDFGTITSDGLGLFAGGFRRIDIGASGNVAIGPAGLPLAVYGRIQVGISGHPGILTITNTAVGGNSFDVGLLNGDLGPQAYLWHRSNAPIHVITNNIQRATFRDVGGFDIDTPSVDIPALRVYNTTTGNRTIARFFGATSDLTISNVGVVDSYTPGSLVGDTSIRAETNGLNLGTLTGPVRITAGPRGIATFSTAGNVTIATPASGATLRVGSGSILFPGSHMSVSHLGNSYLETTDGTRSVLIGADAADGFIGTFTNHIFSLRQNNLTRLQLSLGGNVIINTPTSGPVLTLNTDSGAKPNLDLVSLAGQQAAIRFTQGGQNPCFVYNPASSSNLVFFTGGADRLIIGGIGNTTINAPISGTALTLNGLLGGIAQTWNAGVTVATMNLHSGRIDFGGQSAAIFSLLSSGLRRVEISAGGNVTIAAPASGVPLTVADAVGVQHAVGWLDTPQNAQTSYTLDLVDRGKHIYAAGTTSVITIPANFTVSFPIGTTIVLVNEGTGNMTVQITTDVLAWMQGGTIITGNRIVARGSVVTLLKVASTRWIITGSGIS